MRHTVNSIEIEIEGNEDQRTVTRIYDMGTLTDQINLINHWIEYKGIDYAKKFIKSNFILPIIPDTISYYDYVIDIESWINYENKTKILKEALETYLIDYDKYITESQEDYESGLDDIRLKEGE